MTSEVCSIVGCTKSVMGRGWCVQHYSRWHRHGDPLYEPVVLTLDDRFWAKVNKNGPDGFHSQSGANLGPCWLWTGGITGSGYGAFAYGPRRPRGQRTARTAHRYAYETAKGSIAEGLHLDHLCRVTTCVNPNHLEPVLPQINLERGLPSPSRINRAKTHCVHGHPLSGDNLWVYKKTGERHCRACMRRRHREWVARRDQTQANQSGEEAKFTRTYGGAA